MMLEEHAFEYEKRIRKAVAIRGVTCLEEVP